MTAIDRVSSDDLMSIATNRGTVPMQIGAVAVLDTSRGCDIPSLIASIDSRLPPVARLKRRLIFPSFLRGRPFWADDADFTIAKHVRVVPCPPGSGREGLLAIAARELMTRLPQGQPLWAAIIVTGVNPGVSGVVLIIDHVLADGIGALSILAALTRVEPALPDAEFPRARPSGAALVADSVRRHITDLARLPQSIARLSAGLRELKPVGTKRATRSSLNRPIGSTGNQIVTVGSSVAELAAVAHSHLATINDVVLTAITGALAALLASRGEKATEFVISVPFSSRSPIQSAAVGNQTGAVPLLLPASGTQTDRLRAIATITVGAKRSPRGASTAVLGPMFRALARLGLSQHFVDRQSLVHTFVTNVRGPQSTLRLAGAPITELIPLTTAMGNITVLFAVLSYAADLTITIVADLVTCPDLAVLASALERELIELTALA
jgi:WS/DGAT/MGAT family acyltransferase